MRKYSLTFGIMEPQIKTTGTLSHLYHNQSANKVFYSISILRETLVACHIPSTSLVFLQYLCRAKNNKCCEKGQGRMEYYSTSWSTQQGLRPSRLNRQTLSQKKQQNKIRSSTKNLMVLSIILFKETSLPHKNKYFIVSSS